MLVYPIVDTNSVKEFDKSGTQRLKSIDLYSMLVDAANDALPIIDAGADQIGDRMNQYLVSRLNSTFAYFDVFLTLDHGNAYGALGWAQDGRIFSGMTYWGGAQGVLPGIGSKYGVNCTVVWL